MKIWLTLTPLILWQIAFGQGEASSKQCEADLESSMKKVYHNSGGLEIFPLANVTRCHDDASILLIDSSSIKAYFEEICQNSTVSMESTTSFKPRRGFSPISYPHYGPEFRIELSLRVESFPIDYYANVFQVTYKDDLGGIGSRFPALFITRDGIFHMTSDVNDNRNYYSNHGGIVLGRSYNLIFQQTKKQTGLYEYQVQIDGNTVVGPVENTKKLTLENAKMYLSDLAFESADVTITKMKVSYTSGKSEGES